MQNVGERRKIKIISVEAKFIYRWIDTSSIISKQKLYILITYVISSYITNHSDIYEAFILILIKRIYDIFSMICIWPVANLSQSFIELNLRRYTILARESWAHAIVNTQVKVFQLNIVSGKMAHICIKTFETKTHTKKEKIAELFEFRSKSPEKIAENQAKTHITRAWIIHNHLSESASDFIRSGGMKTKMTSPLTYLSQFSVVFAFRII